MRTLLRYAHTLHIVATNVLVHVQYVCILVYVACVQMKDLPSVSAKTLAADARMAATVAEIFSLATSADP